MRMRVLGLLKIWLEGNGGRLRGEKAFVDKLSVSIKEWVSLTPISGEVRFVSAEINLMFKDNK